MKKLLLLGILLLTFNTIAQANNLDIRCFGSNGPHTGEVIRFKESLDLDDFNLESENQVSESQIFDFFSDKENRVLIKIKIEKFKYENIVLNEISRHVKYTIITTSENSHYSISSQVKLNDLLQENLPEDQSFNLRYGDDRSFGMACMWDYKN